MKVLACRSAVLVAVCLALTCAQASAAVRSIGLAVESFATPSVFTAGNNARCLEVVGESFGDEKRECDAFGVYVTAAGSVASDGSPVTISDVVPAGLTVQRIGLFWRGDGADKIASALGINVNQSDLVPQLEPFGLELCSVATVSCSLPFPVAPDDQLEMLVWVTVSDPTPRPLVNAVSASGGGALGVSSQAVSSVGTAPAGFGVSNFDFASVGLDGVVDRLAGDHPYELTVTFGLNNKFRTTPDGFRNRKVSVEDVKDIVVDLPLGFVGSILASPHCTLTQLSSEQGCPENTRVGFIRSESIASPIWNIEPEHGVPAEFGVIDVLRASHVFYTHVVPTAAGYVLQTTSPDIPQVSLSHIVATFFGNPAERDGTGNAQVPFFTNPTICSGAAMTATVHIDSWAHPGRFHPDGTPDLSDPAWVSKSSSQPPPIGCNALGFSPELKARPTTDMADTPSGLDFELRLAQSELFGTRATPPLRNASVTFPAGFTVDPSAGDGLAGCSEAQIGWVGPGPKDFNQAPPACPEASKVGSLELETPLIGGVLTGSMYLAAQNENPFGSVFGLYVVVQDPATGVLIKIAGRVLTDPQTGQITGIFNENPQLPFSNLKLHFFGGPRAEFATPEQCGAFTTTSVLSPWSAPDSGPDSTPFDSFSIATGCVNGFSPHFNALSTNVQAGAYTPFVASFSRSDSDEELGGLSVTLPPGLLASITGIPLCPDTQADAGNCPEASRVGTLRAGAGPGPNPLFVSGKVYLTGPYNGGPYGLSVVVPAIAGPFNLGTVVVRQSLRIDQHTAQITDVSDPFPTILTPTGADGHTVGVPIRLRRVDVLIDRSAFTFNPTNCSRLQVSGSMHSTQATNASLTAPFQVTNCGALKFTPKFKVSATGRTSKFKGAGLTANLSYPRLAQGSEANIASVKVSLPKQLPSRLTTLQKACLAATFEASPAACPASSIVGHATVTVPLLPKPLTGPAYFVSHGGEAFPSLTIVLQGNGVTVQLVGSTFISKKGITSTTFKALPDVPFNTFQLSLPQGPFSALAANGNLCRAKLVMPTIFTAQNGLQIRQNTPIATTHCNRHKHRKHKHGKATHKR